MHLLDTDTLTHLYFGHQNVLERLSNLTDPDVSITIITRIEVLRGRFDGVLKASDSVALSKAQELLNRTEELLSSLPVVQFDQEALKRFDLLRVTKGLR